MYSNNYNKSLEDSRHEIVWRYIPDKFVIIVSDREDSIIDVPKDASLYKFIRRDRLKTYQSFLDYFNHKTTVPTKFLVLGSAPYMNDWVPKHLKWFIDNDYKIICFNNSWKLVEPTSFIHMWFHSISFNNSGGTYVPTTSEIPLSKRIVHSQYNQHKECEQSVLPRPDPKIPVANKLYNCSKRTTMFFDVIYCILKTYGENADVVVIGCDMIYTKNGDTFYSHLNVSKARNDPIINLGEAGLNAELLHSLKMYDKYGYSIKNASTYETRLPYPKFRMYLD